MTFQNAKYLVLGWTAVLLAATNVAVASPAPPGYPTVLRTKAHCGPRLPDVFVDCSRLPDNVEPYGYHRLAAGMTSSRHPIINVDGDVYEPFRVWLRATGTKHPVLVVYQTSCLGSQPVETFAPSPETIHTGTLTLSPGRKTRLVTASGYHCTIATAIGGGAAPGVREEILAWAPPQH